MNHPRLYTRISDPIMTFLQEVLITIVDINYAETGRIFANLIQSSNEFFVLPIFRTYMVSLGHWRRKQPDKDLNKLLKFYRDKQPEQHHTQFWTTLISNILSEYQSTTPFTKKFASEESMGLMTQFQKEQVPQSKH